MKALNKGINMEAKRKEKLAQLGWQETTVEEFLGLTPEEVAYIELKLALSQALKEVRQQQKLSQQALAERIQSSQSRVAKMEKSDSSISLDILIRSLLALGVTPQEIGGFMGG